jgi:VCBS repeat-containing protein
MVDNTPNGLNDLWQYDRTLGQWIWRSGSNSPSAGGVYGAVTVEAAGNTPGARHTGSTWTDSSNNLWLFGGFNGNSTFPARYNDLWRYRPSTGRWTWMKGSSSGGQAGVYGTKGVAAAGNTPGARQGAASWFTPDGNLWLFGGFNGTAYFNDLWSYNLTSGNWTWVSGSNTTGAFGTYGTQGTADAANVPGARRDATGGWVGADGSLWMFGGLGLPASGAAGNLNDLWKYDRTLGQWTWVKGGDSINPVGVYGTQGTPDAANTPGGRSGGSGWVTVVGGFTDSRTIQSDVWIYDSSTNEWVWTLGANTNNARGVYGTLGVADPANQPGARFTPGTWVTLNGALWIFGGGGTDAFGSSGRLSDLWSYSIPPPAGAPLLPAPEPFPDSFTINADPSANNASAGTMAYVPVSGQLTGKDADGDIILFGTDGTTLSHGTLTLQSNGQWTYAPALGYVGTDTFTFRASDYYGGQSPTRTLTITVATNPADADNDGIADSYEQGTFGSTGADALGDADGDGQSNYFEYLAGTNPVDSAQTLTTAPSIAAGASANGGSFKLDLSHVRPGVNYHLETSSDLDVWNRIGTFTFSVSGSATIEDPTAPTGQPAFYRISLEAPALLP